MEPLILYRGRSFEQEEKEAADRYFETTNSRLDVGYRNVVICRYSCLPYYGELARDIQRLGGIMINTPLQHQYIADLNEWYADLSDLTPRTWFSLDEFLFSVETEPALKREDLSRSYVLKGATNSRKFSWSTHMFAKSWSDVPRIHDNLRRDVELSEQPIYIREYVPLRVLVDGVGDVPPVSEEYRFFAICGKRFCGAYYWSTYEDDIKEIPPITPDMEAFVDEIVERTKDKTNALCIDVARKQDGSLMLVELNDLQMSGLSGNSPNQFYRGLYDAVMENWRP